MQGTKQWSFSFRLDFRESDRITLYILEDERETKSSLHGKPFISLIWYKT